MKPTDFRRSSVTGLAVSELSPRLKGPKHIWFQFFNLSMRDFIYSWFISRIKKFRLILFSHSILTILNHFVQITWRSYRQSTDGLFSFTLFKVSLSVLNVALLFIHPSIFYHSPGVRLRGAAVKAGKPRLLSSQLLCPTLPFPGQPRDIVSSVCPVSFWEPPTGGMCP